MLSLTPCNMQGDTLGMSLGAVVAQGRCTDTNERGSLLAIHETAGTWVFYPPIGERGVRLSAEDAIRVAEKILADAHGRS